MDNLLHRLNLSVRLLKGEGKHTLAQYIAGQLETLQRIQEGAPYLLCTCLLYTSDVYKRQGI